MRAMQKYALEWTPERTMRRRDFGKAILGTIAGAGLSACVLPELASAQTAAARPHKKNLKMHVGADYHVIEGNNIISRENINYNLRCGVTHRSEEHTSELQSLR